MTQPFNDDRVHALLERLLVLPRAQRSAALDDACADDPALRQRIEHLLALAEDSEGFLDRSPTGDLPVAVGAGNTHVVGRTIGAYRLLRCLGTGGMAEVWLAERIEGGFRQQVAIKLIAHGPGRMGERFASEREILASLTHPGIARLYDGGVEPGGLAYMVMEYIEGEHLVAWCQARALPLAQRLALFLQVCDAVAYAHTRLVVHRDIKPANILVTAEGQAKLLDFGIAKLLDDAPSRSDAGQSTGTVQLSPAYAAPEQLSGELIGTPTDVYALGITLFELLVGRLPWAGETTSLAMAMRRLLDDQVPVLSRSATAASPIPGRALRGDLDAIVGRALRREPEQRYPDARALAEDLRRHLEHRPVQARIGVRGYVARRTLRRHWRGLALVAAVFVALSAALLAIAWQAHKAQQEAQRAAAVQAFMVDLFRTNSGKQSDPVQARQTTARELLDIGVKRIGTQLDDAPENKLALLRLFGDLYGEFALSSEQIPVRTQAVALSRRLYGANAPELASDLIALAKVTTDSAKADGLLDQARAILDYRHQTDSFLRGRLLAASVGNHYTDDLKRARGEAAQAVAVLGRYPDSPELADALYMQGIVTAYGGDKAAAIAPLKRAVEVSIAAEGKPNPLLSNYYRQLGETQSYALQHADAEASLRQAIAQAQAYKAEYHYDLVRAEATMAVVLVNADRPRESLPYAARAAAAAPPLSEGAGALYLKTHTLNTVSRTQVRAGDLDGALTAADAAIKLARTFDPEGTVLVTALQRRAEALAELGRAPEAQQTLAEAVRLLSRAGSAPSEFNTLLAIRIALDQGHLDQARKAFAALAPLGDNAPVAKTVQRALTRADIALAQGDNADAARIAADAIAKARASGQVASLGSAISDGELIQGLAHLRTGDAGIARPLLDSALSRRTALYLPQSPRIAEAQLALAACALAQGQRREASTRLAQAKAIETQHSTLSPRYRQPLAQLRAQLGRGSG